ncbi:MAG: DUF2948 family protein [Pseudomonadota bacterium]
MSSIRPLKLAALDEADLSVISAHVQDAVMKVADIRWSAGSGTVLMPMNRFAWEETGRGKSRQSNQRRRAVLHFDRVQRFQAVGVSAKDRDAVLSVLAVVFDEADAPEGTVSVVCAGEAMLRLQVECVEARLTDLGAAWSASMRPKHLTGR